MSAETRGPHPAAQDDLVTLDAELRRALQHQRAEMERAREAQQELSRLIERARTALERTRQGVHREERDEPQENGRG